MSARRQDTSVAAKPVKRRKIKEMLTRIRGRKKIKVSKTRKVKESDDDLETDMASSCRVRHQPGENH